MNDIICIDADRMIDGRGGPPVERARVLTQGERITAAGPADRIEAPEGARRISFDLLLLSRRVLQSVLG